MSLEEFEASLEQQHSGWKKNVEKKCHKNRILSPRAKGLKQSVKLGKKKNKTEFIVSSSVFTLLSKIFISDKYKM